MKKKPRIMVLKLREIIYTLIFLALGIFLIVLLIHMFSGKAGAEASADSKYVPGVYTSTLLLGSRHVDVEVAVDEDRIQGIRLVDLDESVTAMYPLVEPAIASLEEQILASQSVEQVALEEDSRYTGTLLLNAISNALSLAEP